MQELHYFLLVPDNPPEIHKRPSEHFCKDFVRAYLVRRRELSAQGVGDVEITEDVVDMWFRNACLCMPVSLPFF